ncbi:MAG: formylglycine-generating enzyme family protein [Kofleriaceae bacterium]
MGCANWMDDKRIGELGCMDDSRPLHRVRLRAFAIDRLEVTWAEYATCIKQGQCPAAKKPSFEDLDKHPRRAATYVTWDGAQKFCASRGKRLPTEAEWEKAGRGTDLRSRPWGDQTATCQLAGLARCVSVIDPPDVGQYPKGASPYGVLDLVGGVKEWVADRYEKTYYLTSPVDDPKGPSTGIHRTIRGSSYKSFEGMEALYGRYGREPSYAEDDLGFRCAKSL